MPTSDRRSDRSAIMSTRFVSYNESVKLNPRQFTHGWAWGFWRGKVQGQNEPLPICRVPFEIQPTPLAYLELGKILAQATAGAKRSTHQGGL